MKLLYWNIILIVLIVLAIVGSTYVYFKDNPIDLNLPEYDFVDYNDTVTVDYELIVDNEILESSFDKDSNMIFKIGNNEVIPGFENAILGAKINDIVNVKIAPEDGYGRNAQIIPLQESIDNIMIYVKQVTGKEYNISDLMNKTMDFSIYGKRYTCVTKDYNLETNLVDLDCVFYLALKELNFKIQVLDINKSNS